MFQPPRCPNTRCAMFTGPEPGRPLTLPIVLERNSRFLLWSGSAPIRPRGKMTDKRLAAIAADEARFGPRRDRSRPALVLALKELRRWTVQHPRVTLETDEKSLYPVLAKRVLGPDRLVHSTVNSKLVRDTFNPLFPINHTEAMVRDLTGRLRRDSWLASKERPCLNSQLMVWMTWRWPPDEGLMPRKPASSEKFVENLGNPLAFPSPTRSSVQAVAQSMTNCPAREGREDEMSAGNAWEGTVSAVSQGKAPGRNGDRQRILVVDDEAEVLSSLRATLEPAGYEVHCTSSLAEGLEALQRETFHLVLTDLYLGEEDLGYRLAETARSCNPRVPVILLTGRPSFNGAQEALRTRVAEIVVKPTPPHSILATCRRTIHDAELTRRAQALEVQNRVLASVLPRAIEVKDPTTRGHAERVVCYADVLAERCAVREEDREDLRLASLLHDVGKIGIPNRILTKPGPLTTDEREVIQRHPAMGFEILAPMDHSENVRRWVYQHHERWDGRGYPEGLQGEDVELPGRILILAEVFDALAERRSYKEPWSMAKIAAFFRDQAGRQFDPELSHLVADGVEGLGPRFFASRDSLF